MKSIPSVLQLGLHFSSGFVYMLKINNWLYTDHKSLTICLSLTFQIIILKDSYLKQIIYNNCLFSKYLLFLKNWLVLLQW